MAGNLQFNLVSPERKLASVAATEVQLPASAGDMTAMAGHTPTITTLRPGLLRATTAEGVKSFVVIGGFADISADAVTVLAERAVPADEADAALFDQLIAEARDAANAAAGEGKADAEKALTDLSALRDQLRKV